jgi:hypothetical protein
MSNHLDEFARRGQKQVHWHRFHEDGLPFRGDVVPNLTSDEFDDRLKRTGDPKNEFFDMTKAEDKQQYLAVQDKIVNGWAQLLFVDRQPRKDSLGNVVGYTVYIEWVEFYMEDSKAQGSTSHGHKDR